ARQSTNRLISSQLRFRLLVLLTTDHGPMQLCKVQLAGGAIRAGVLEGDKVRLLASSLSEILHAGQPGDALQERLDRSRESVPLSEARLLTPVEQQEVWAAGVTYKRSEEARKRESVGAARFYDLVYSAPRPEL